MSTSQQQVVEFLERGRWRYRMDQRNDRIVCRADAAHGRWTVEIRVTEGGDCLVLRVPRVVEVGDSPYVDAVARALLELHFEIKLGRFGLSALDGEIDCEIVLPLDDAVLSYRQFQRALGALLLLADQQAPRLAAILTHGPAAAVDTATQWDSFITALASATGLSREAIAESIAGDETPPDG